MSPTPVHPSWCEYPLAPSDETHTHTAAVGGACLSADTTIEMVLVQASDSHQPVLTMHLVAPTGRLSLDITGAQAWALAGVLIDATVAHAQAAPGRATTAPAGAEVSTPPSGRAANQDRSLWLLDRHPNGRMPGRRTARQPFRCWPGHHPPNDERGGLDDSAGE
jgi:hypothetical protein